MLRIHRIHAFSDNYIWVIADDASAWAVDPGDASPVIKFLETHQLSLIGILLTHWHGDHQGGVEDLCTRYPGLRIIGSKKSLKGPSRPVVEGEMVEVLGALFRVIEVPGHTLDHVAFFSDSDLFEIPVAFTGDTLFVAGCGRLFEGTAENMFESLQKLDQLPGNTAIYCAHEYTLANLKYATIAEPENPDIQKRLAKVEELRSKHYATVPTTLVMERLTNPFLRAKDASELAARRLQKDNF
ncbi:MAG: hydroxyacylglutathione hydrolase [Pseudomonadota bacterium]|nr:hydroxyacylglutathione hydrolase [Pseudomonadota bacterium]